MPLQILIFWYLWQIGLTNIYLIETLDKYFILRYDENCGSCFESEAKRLMDLNLALPAYEMVLKAGHTFNLLDARGAISVTERAAYIGRIRQISRAVAQSYYDSRERLGFPMCQKKE